MSYQRYFDQMKKIEENLLDFIEDETANEKKFQELINVFADSKISDDKHNFTSLLHLILKIGNFHFRGLDFFGKIEQILQYYKDNIKKYFSNSEIFNIFKDNKRILLFLLEEKMMVIDDHIAKIMMSGKYIDSQYPGYFQPEIEPFNKKKFYFQSKLPEDFNEKRKKGENDSYIAQLIQKDMIQDFIVCVNQNNISVNEFFIKPSIYETNSYLNKKLQISLIEYAAFFGSINIFNYLRMSNVALKESLVYYAIHGKNAEIIRILEENLSELKLHSYQFYKEAITMHHNDIANYFLNNFLPNEESDSNNISYEAIKYYNFEFMKDKIINERSFFYFFKYDYSFLVNLIMTNSGIDINKKIKYIDTIQNHILQ